MGLRCHACAGMTLALALVGCTTGNPTRGEEDFASRLIAEKAAIAAGAQRDYAALLAEDYSTVTRRQATFDTDTIDVDYIGNPRELVQSIASRYGYGFSETGRPIDMRPINIRMKGATPDSVLRNIGNQMNAAADIVLDRNARTVAIEYKARDSAHQGS